VAQRVVQVKFAGKRIEAVGSVVQMAGSVPERTAKPPP
jgi:hypothetical protein